MSNTSISQVSHIHSLTADFLKKRLAQNGFDDFASSHGNILFQLSINKAITMKELAAKINRDKSTTTVLVRKLEQEGLVTATTDTSDKRNKILTLTEKGTEYNALMKKLSKELVAKFYKGFSDKEIEQFSEFLNRIESNFE
ncbi:MAG: MarR family transcriptional regulator [Treponema sp.]|nr:MarR family transcriptional regulator [Treponema sp.]